MLNTPLTAFAGWRAGCGADVGVGAYRVRRLFARVGRYRRGRTGLTKIANAQIRRLDSLSVAVVEQSVHPPVMSWGVVCFTCRANKGQEGRAWGDSYPRIGTAGSATVVPHDQPQTGLSDRTFFLTCRTSGAVVKAVTALPLLFDRALENSCIIGRRGAVGRNQTAFETGTGRSVRNLRRVER